MAQTSMTEQSLFASQSLLGHVARGLIGGAMLSGAIAIAAEQPWLSLLLGGGALLAFRGCPMCWAVGLVETATRAWKQREQANT